MARTRDGRCRPALRHPLVARARTTAASSEIAPEVICPRQFGGHGAAHTRPSRRVRVWPPQPWPRRTKSAERCNRTPEHRAENVGGVIQ